MGLLQIYLERFLLREHRKLLEIKRLRLLTALETFFLKSDQRLVRLEVGAHVVGLRPCGFFLQLEFLGLESFQVTVAGCQLRSNLRGLGIFL